MTQKSSRIGVLAAALLLGLMCMPVLAQGRGGVAALQPLMGASDEQFATLQPLIQAVMDDRTAAGLGGAGGRGGRGGRRGGAPPPDAGGAAPAAPAQPAAVAAAAELNTALQDASSTPDVIKAKLEALRTARKAAMAKLATDQEALKKAIGDNVKFEAALVAGSYLD